jgi:hypothetical protein
MFMVFGQESENLIEDVNNGVLYKIYDKSPEADFSKALTNFGEYKPLLKQRME